MNESIIDVIKFLKEYGLSDAIFGFIGVIVGAFVPMIIEERKDWSQRSRFAKYLAARVICILDDFVNKCYEIVLDDGTDEQGRPAGREVYGNGYCDEFYLPQVKLPEEITFPTDVDWKSIEANIMYRILVLPSSIRSTNQTIYSSSEHSFPPGNEPVFEAMHEGYSKLGIEAIEIANELRKKYKLPKREYEFYNPQEKFEETIARYR